MINFFNNLRALFYHNKKICFCVLLPSCNKNLNVYFFVNSIGLTGFNLPCIYILYLLHGKRNPSLIPRSFWMFYNQPVLTTWNTDGGWTRDNQHQEHIPVDISCTENNRNYTNSCKFSPLLTSSHVVGDWT